MGRCGEFFSERGVPWKPWNLSGSATGMVLVSHMVSIQDNTSGHLQLLWTELAIVLIVAVILSLSKYHPPPACYDYIPPFVGEDYFCDAAQDGLQTDLLWTSYMGSDCLCCGNRSRFYKQLPQPTTDDIEMRVCKDEDDENIGLEYVFIYVR